VREGTTSGLTRRGAGIKREQRDRDSEKDHLMRPMGHFHLPALRFRLHGGGRGEIREYRSDSTKFMNPFAGGCRRDAYARRIDQEGHSQIMTDPNGSKYLEPRLESTFPSAS